MKKLLLFVLTLLCFSITFSQSVKKKVVSGNSRPAVKADTTKDESPSVLLKQINFVRVDTIPGAVSIYLKSMSGPLMKTYQAFLIDSIFIVKTPVVSSDQNSTYYNKQEGRKMKVLLALTEQGPIPIDINKWYLFVPYSLIN